MQDSEIYKEMKVLYGGKSGHRVVAKCSDVYIIVGPAGLHDGIPIEGKKSIIWGDVIPGEKHIFVNASDLTADDGNTSRYKYGQEVYSKELRSVVKILGQDMLGSILVDRKDGKGHDGGSPGLKWGSKFELSKNGGWWLAPNDISIIPPGFPATTEAPTLQHVVCPGYVTAIGTSDYVSEGEIYSCTGRFIKGELHIPKDKIGDPLTPMDSFALLRISTPEEIEAAKAGYKTLKDYRTLTPGRIAFEREEVLNFLKHCETTELKVPTKNGASERDKYYQDALIVRAPKKRKIFYINN